MLIKVNETWPFTSTCEVNKTYGELAEKQLPRFSKTIGLKMVPSGCNIKSCMIYEITHGQENKGIKELVEILTRLSVISGYEWDIEVESPDREKECTTDTGLIMNRAG